ncbi:hypothetical protein GOP47_0007150 [Adiantum capillus-veneris]|uniref:Uncharacterized protein n=1 Tax=Adiantum capillus-veneris TaxID=13818 RepID=A0A9D4V049_ADICA|nr:hypothetical protein GOP47_0007150 [Adiantum capillus-veneris]
MFDLNEVPDLPALEADGKAAPSPTSNGDVNNDIPQEAASSCKSLPLSHSSMKDDGPNPVVEEVDSVRENLTFKRPAASSLSLELTPTKRYNASVSITAQQQDGDREDAPNHSAMGDLGLRLPQEQLLDQQSIANETDHSNTVGKVAFHFLGVSSGDASTSRKHELLESGTPVNKQDNGMTGTILSLECDREPVAASEGSALGLSLGGIFSGTRTLNTIGSISKGKESIASGVGKVEVLSLASRKSSDLSPFWHGKLRPNDSFIYTPIVAYCLGIMTPHSRLKKLPSTLMPRRFLKFEELEKTVNKGVTEPLIQFKPSMEASNEEVKLFYAMVTALSRGSEILQSPTFSGSTSGLQGLPADGQSAALISWDGDSSDAKFCLISIPSIQALLKFSKPSSIAEALEGIDGLDPESLYGIICHNTSGASNKKLDPLPYVQNTGKIDSSRRPERVLEDSITSAERGKDTSTVNHTTSPSNRKHLTARPDGLSKSVSLQPIRSSIRDINYKLDLEEAGKSSKRRYEKQLSSTDRVHEASGKYHSRNGSGTRDFDEGDRGHRSHEQGQSKQREKLSDARHGSRQEWRSDRLKESQRRSKDDRDSSKQRAKENHRHAYRDEEKDKTALKSHGTGELRRDQDKLHFKERERSTKENVMEDFKLKSSTEKNNAGSKNKVSLSHRISPDHDSSRLSRKRDREDEKERAVSAKRPRELGDNDSKQLIKDSSSDLKPKPGVERIHDYSPQGENVFVNGSDSTKSAKNHQTLDIANGSFDGTVGMDMDAHMLDANLAMPSPGHGTVDGGSKMSNEPCGLSLSLLGAGEIITSRNPLRLFDERSGQAEDGGVPSEILVDPSLDKVNEEKDLSVEFTLDIPDKETRTWLLSKQNTFYLEEEYGVHATLTADPVNSDGDAKIDPQTGLVTVRIFAIPSESCDTAEDKWFLDQASATVKSIASRGVFIKCFWYEGPVQIHPGDGAPSVPVIVKKIKGEDGKNLERIQDLTGVMIGVVLRKCGTGTPHEMELLSRPRFIGLRLKCVRRKGLLEASKEAEALLESVADHFSKELATHIATHIVDLQASALHPCETISNQGSPLVPTMATKDLLPNLPVKDEGSPGPCKLDEASVLGADRRILLPKEEPDATLSTELEVASRSLYVSSLPDHVTPIKIHNIFEKVLREKLEPWGNFDHFSDLVIDVKYKPEKSSALVLLVSDALLNASLKLYAEDITVFQNMKIELGPSERQGSVTRVGVRSRDSVNREHVRSTTLGKREEENISRRQGAANNDDDSECSQDQWFAENIATRTDPFPSRPRPLFLSELMRNASAPVIKQLFEDIITTYIGPNLVSPGGRQLVLDVRYVPSRGCAFVDLATPELVEFMLDLHSRRPEVFMNMKMELGRKPVPYSVEEDGGGRLNLRLHGKSHFSSQTFGYRLSLASRKKTEKRTNGSFDLEDSDKGDDLLWLSARMKKQRSDPEKTIYVDRLPENATEGTIKKIFERVLGQKVAREELDALGDQLITEDEEIFESMRLKPHFHSRMEDLYRDELQEIDEIVHTPSLRERMASLDSDNARLRQPTDLHDSRTTRSAAHRAITASAFREVDRRRSVYVDKIPEDLSESTMTEMFEKVFRMKKHGYDGHMVSQVAYFRDKFDPSKLCAFVEVKTEGGTQDLVDYYNANQDAFRGMRVRPGFKYHS